MNKKNPETDSGKYVNGIYTTKNGFSGLGLNCPKGTRLYNTEKVSPIFFMPEERGETEVFEMITREVCPGIMPYYAISNYGRLMNVNSGKIMKPNYRPNGYEYYCLASENAKYGQTKYNTNRIVMKTFDPRDNADELEVNHINGVKSENYINKTMEDGSIQSNLEWATKSENIQHSHDTGLNIGGGILTQKEVNKIRRLKEEGYSYNRIREEFFPNLSGTTIQAICKNIMHYDPLYKPPTDFCNSAYMNVSNNGLKISDIDADKIRKLHQSGFSYSEIKDKYYPNVSVGTISDVCRYKTHNREIK